MTRRGEVVVEGHPVGHLEGFRFVPDPVAEGDEKRLVVRAARRALREEMPRRVAAVETAPDALALTDDHAVTWDGAGRPPEPGATSFARGSVIGQRVPRRRPEGTAARAAATLRRRHSRGPRAAVRRRRAPAAVRGPLHRLGETLGIIPGTTKPAGTSARSQNSACARAGLRCSCRGC